jgi:hypothetical protein
VVVVVVIVLAVFMMQQLLLHPARGSRRTGQCTKGWFHKHPKEAHDGLVAETRQCGHILLQSLTRSGHLHSHAYHSSKPASFELHRHKKGVK